MPTAPTFFCTAIPDLRQPKPGELRVAVLVTPLIQGDVAEKLEKIPAPFDAWPSATGLPFDPKAGTKVHATLAPMGQPVPPAVEATIEKDAGVTKEVAERLWRQLFAGTIVEVAVGQGATSDGNYDAPNQNLEATAESQRQGASTVEGIGTQDLMREVVLPLLSAHFFNNDGRGPKDDYLDQASFALERLDRLGSSGAASGARLAKGGGDGSGGGADEKEEFHELISAIGDDRTLLRFLGLVFNVRVPLPADWQTGERQFNLRVKLTLPAGPAEGDLGRATPCRLREATLRDGKRARICHVDCDRTGTIAGEDSLTGSGFIVARTLADGVEKPVLDTVQADPVAVLRAALRDREDRRGTVKPGDGTATTRGRRPAERRAPLLLGHGITIFRREGAAFFRNIGTNLKAPGSDQALGPDVWAPEQLARGYVVDVRARPPGDKWSDWVKLCGRRVNYRLPKTEKDTTEMVVLENHRDETCLSVASSEGATPLGGFLLGPLLKPTEAGSRPSLSKDDLDRLGYPPDDLFKVAVNSFIVATPGGLITVADVPSLDDFRAEKPTRLGPIGTRIRALMSETGGKQLAGGWIDLSGATAAGGRHFLATGAEFADELSGIAALVRAEDQTRLLGEIAPVLDPNAQNPPPNDSLFQNKLTAIATRRQSYGLENGFPIAADNFDSLILLRFNTATNREDFGNSLRTHLQQEPRFPPLAHARGEAALAVRELNDLQLDTLARDLRLVFTRVIAGQQLEFRPHFDRDDSPVEPLSVTLTAAADVKVTTFTRPDAPLQEIPEGSLFRVELRSLTVREPSLEIVRLTEIGRTREGTLVQIERRENPRAYFVRLQLGDEESYPIDENGTLVEIHDRLNERATSEEKVERAAPLASGRWRDLAHLLQRGDRVSVDLALQTDGVTHRVERLVVLARDPANFLLGTVTTTLLTPIPGEIAHARREDVLVIADLANGRRTPVVVNDGTLVTAGPASERGAWRTRQQPPEGALVRVFLDPAQYPGEPAHARLVEILQTLRAKLSTIREASGDVVFEVQLLDFSRTLEFKAARAALPTEADFGWLKKRFDDAKRDAFEIAVNDAGRLVELRFRAPGRWEKRGAAPNETLRFIAAHEGVILELQNSAGDFSDAGTAAGAEFELRWLFTDAGGAALARCDVYARPLRPRATSVRVQFKKEQPDTTIGFAARVLKNPDDYFAPVEGRDRLVFLMPKLRTELDPPKPAKSLLEQIIAAQLPIEIKAIASVFIDLTESNRSPTTYQWWSIRSLHAPQPLPADRAPWPIFADRAEWMAGAASPVFEQPQREAGKPAWTIARAADVANFVVPPFLLEGAWPRTPLTFPSPDDPKPTAPLLPDQVIVDDALVHWFGGSLAKNESRRTAFDSADPPPEPSRLAKRVRIGVEIPEDSLCPLRIGWEYEFRLRAVWVTADPADFDAPYAEVEAQASIYFFPFGQDASEKKMPGLGLANDPLRGFRRVEPFHPPRVGWPHTGSTSDGGPDNDGWIKAPDTTCPEQAKARDHFAIWGVLPPRVARPLAIQNVLNAGSPTDLIVHSDVATFHGTPLHKEPRPKGTFADLQPLTALNPSVLLVLRPAEIAHREAERLSKFEDWEQAHRDHTLYWDVLWAYDEVEPSEKWWEALPAYNVYPHDLGRDPTQEEESRFWEPTHEATEKGSLLHRIPDPDAGTITITIVVESEPGKWTEKTDLVLAGAERRVDFYERKDAQKGWPRLREYRLQIIPLDERLGAPTASLQLEKDNRTITLRPPRDVEWAVEIRTAPRSGATAAHAFAVFVARDNKENEHCTRFIKGHHPLAEPALRLRLRHATNQPRQAPRKLSLQLTPRLVGDTDAHFRGRYEIDRPSTGALALQAALEMEYLDDPEAPLPRVPAFELHRILALGREVSQRPIVPALTGKILGRSADSARTLRLDEFAIAELELKNQAVSAFGPPEEQIEFTHAIGDVRHRRVFYRALAISRWEALFPRAFLPGTTAPLCHANPLRGPFSEKEAEAIERVARQRGEVEPWTWYRVDLPATRRPSPPRLAEAQRLRIAFSWEPEWCAEARWAGGGGRWRFSRTRLPGCRVWLARPWFSSGADEKLAVLCLHRTRIRRAERERTLGLVSRWGADAAGTPIPEADAIPKVGLLTRASFLSAEPGSPAEIEVPPPSAAGGATIRFGEPVNPAAAPTGDEPIRLGLAVHTPRFHVGEGAWFCDLFIRAQVYRPFLYLSLARYQPHSLPGVALSAPIQPHPVPVLPQRVLEISLVAEGGVLRAEITVSGLISAVFQREVVCKLQRLGSPARWFAEDPIAGAIIGDDHGPLPAPHANAPVEMDTTGEFWQSLPCRGPDNAPALAQPLALVNTASATYRASILIEPHHLTDTACRLRLFIEEIEDVPPARASQAVRSTGPCYFDYVELPRGFADFLR